MKIRKAVIPAAGMGTRFLPATKAQPKEMLPLVDKPAIQYIVEEAVESGIEDILIVTWRFKRAIEDHFDRSMELEMHLVEHEKHEVLEVVQQISNLANIHYIRQPELRGLGHAIFMARSYVGNEPFAVLLGDDIIRSKTPCLKQLINLYEETGASIVGVQEVDILDVSKYGILDAEKTRECVYKVNNLVEKPAPDVAPSRLGVMGRYIITPAVFEILSHTEPGAGGEIQLTDALRVLCREESMYGLVFQGKRYDIGDKLGYLKAMVDFALDRPDLSEGFTQYLKQVAAHLV